MRKMQIFLLILIAFIYLNYNDFSYAYPNSETSEINPKAYNSKTFLKVAIEEKLKVNELCAHGYCQKVNMNNLEHDFLEFQNIHYSYLEFMLTEDEYNEVLLKGFKIDEIKLNGS